MLERPGRVDQQRGESLHPRVQGDVIGLHAAFSEEFHKTLAKQPESQIPAHRQWNHFRLGPKASERRQSRRGGKSELYASFQHFRRHHAIPRRNSARQGTVAVVPLVEHPAGDVVRGSRLKLPIVRLPVTTRECPGPPALTSLHCQGGCQSRLSDPIVILVPVSTHSPETVIESGGLS